MKAFEQPRSAITLTPVATMIDNRYKFATMDANGALVVAGAGVKAVGVLQTPGIAGEPCNVMTEGVSFVILGGVVASGAEVEINADGSAITLAAGKSNGICLVGGAAGSIGSILLK